MAFGLKGSGAAGLPPVRPGDTVSASSRGEAAAAGGITSGVRRSLPRRALQRRWSRLRIRCSGFN